MSTAVNVAFAAPDPAACPPDFSSLVTLLSTLVSASIPDPFTPYVVGNSTPAVDQQGYIWFKLDGAGRPVGIYKYYSGTWRRVYNGSYGEIRWFTGDPSGYFDGTGRGVVGSEWDGWAFMNGANGTFSFANAFPIAANMNSSGGESPYVAGVGWRTRVEGASHVAGGQASTTLSLAQVPRPATQEIKDWLWSADGNSGRNGGNLYGTSSVPGQSVIRQSADAGVASPTPVPTVPPYLALCPVQFVGYA